MTDVKKFNNQSIGEEIVNAISHGIGTILAIAGTAVLIVKSVKFGRVIDVVTSSLYGASLIILFLMSTLYHSFTNYKAKKVFQIFDHCSIFLLILGSYIPISLSLIGGPIGWALFGVNTFLAILGIVFNSINLTKWHKASLILYVLMGWSAIFIIKPLWAMVSINGWILLIAGGVLYTVGIFFYKAKKPRFMHSIWHLFVLSASILHYFFMLFYVI